MFPFTILNKEEIQIMEAFHRLLENTGPFQGISTEK